MVYENFGDELALGMCRGLDALPAGPERSAECKQRLSEASEGLVQIQLILGETEEALDVDAGAYIGGLDACAQRLVWAGEMADGIRRGIQLVEEFDIDGSDDYPYQAVKACLAQCDETRSRLEDKVAALEPLEDGVEAVTGSTPHASAEGKSIAKIKELGKAVCSDCVPDLVNDFFAEEFTMVLERIEWLFQPTVMLFELLSPTARHLPEVRQNSVKLQHVIQMPCT